MLNDIIIIYANFSTRYSENAGISGSTLAERCRITTIAELDIGDCTAHHGWIYHSAPDQPDQNHQR